MCNSIKAAKTAWLEVPLMQGSNCKMYFKFFQISYCNPSWAIVYT